MGVIGYIHNLALIGIIYRVEVQGEGIRSIEPLKMEYMRSIGNLQYLTRDDVDPHCRKDIPSLWEAHEHPDGKLYFRHIEKVAKYCQLDPPILFIYP